MPLNRCGSVSARLMVWLSRVSAARNSSSVALERLEAAGIERRQRRGAAHQLHRRALARAGLGEEQRAVIELEDGEHQLRRRNRQSDRARRPAGFAPAVAGSPPVRRRAIAAARRSSDARPRTAHRRTPARCACRAGGRRGPSGRAARSIGGSTERSTNGLSSRTPRSGAADDARVRAPRCRRSDPESLA